MIKSRQHQNDQTVDLSKVGCQCCVKPQLQSGTEKRFPARPLHEPPTRLSGPALNSGPVVSPTALSSLSWLSGEKKGIFFRVSLLQKPLKLFILVVSKDDYLGLFFFYHRWLLLGRQTDAKNILKVSKKNVLLHRSDRITQWSCFTAYQHIMLYEHVLLLIEKSTNMMKASNQLVFTE